MTDEERERFDALVDDAVAALPPRVRALLDEVPVVVLDEPTPEMLRDVGIEPSETGALDELCGLHTGIALTERSVEHSGEMPTMVHLFRRGIISLAGGWDQPHADEEIYEEIRTTLLHEIGHHFGLDEDDLAALGYD
jgi:predicted Zn-dependent protease with MMP-like domain